MHRTTAASCASWGWMHSPLHVGRSCYESKIVRSSRSVLSIRIHSAKVHRVTARSIDREIVAIYLDAMKIIGITATDTRAKCSWITGVWKSKRGIFLSSFFLYIIFLYIIECFWRRWVLYYWIYPIVYHDVSYYIIYIVK